MMSKCGLTGGSSSQIKINYNVKPTLKIIGIPITPTISQSANIDCPTQVRQSFRFRYLGAWHN